MLRSVWCVLKMQLVSRSHFEVAFQVPRNFAQEQTTGLILNTSAPLGYKVMIHGNPSCISQIVYNFVSSEIGYKNKPPRLDKWSTAAFIIVLNLFQA